MTKLTCLFAFLVLMLCHTEAQTVSCDASLWNHVYHNYRLAIDSSCMDVTGTVYSLIYEADGDIHIRLTVDPQFTYMLNSSNYSGELGKLVLEPICATTVTQSDAISSCRGFTNTVYIPNVGETITARGPYVTDNDHGWNELHPLTSITLHGAAGVQALDLTIMDGFKVYPSPADDQLSMEFATQLNAPTYITIYDQLGRSGGNYQMLDTRKLTITTTYLPDGIYIYSIRQTAGVLGDGQFVVKHTR
jgi:hypothetical protein